MTQPSPHEARPFQQARVGHFARGDPDNHDRGSVMPPPESASCMIGIVQDQRWCRAGWHLFEQRLRDRCDLGIRDPDIDGRLKEHLGDTQADI